MAFWALVIFILSMINFRASLPKYTNLKDLAAFEECLDSYMSISRDDSKALTSLKVNVSIQFVFAILIIIMQICSLTASIFVTCCRAKTKT